MLYAPNEVGVCGATSSEVAKLITALTEAFAPRYRVGCLTLASRPFAGTGSPDAASTALRRGASLAFAGGADGFAYLGSSAIDPAIAPALWQEVDLLLVQGGEHIALPKIVVVNATGDILDRIEGGRTGNVIALAIEPGLPESVVARAEKLAARGEIGPEGMEIPALLGLDDLSSIRDFLLAFFDATARRAPLYGIVLSGGMSSRMQRDKGSIDYHGVPQVRYAYGLLEGVCERTFVSIRSERAADPLFEGLNQIPDRFLGIGPMGGILSALHAHPDAAWLVLGCDLPLVTKGTLEELVAARDPLKLATCYDSSTDGFPEPLCAIYEPGIRPRLLQFLAMGRDCPRKALINSRSHRIRLSDPHALDNVNDPEEMARVKAAIGERVLAGARSSRNARRLP